MFYFYFLFFFWILFIISNFKVQIKDWNFQIRELIEMWKKNEDNNKENFDVIKFYIIFCQLNIKTLKKIFEEKKYKLKTI